MMQNMALRVVLRVKAMSEHVSASPYSRRFPIACLIGGCRSCCRGLAASPVKNCRRSGGCSDINCQREFGRGMSYDRIAKQLNADGVTGKAGGKFYASTVHKIVGNDLHA